MASRNSIGGFFVDLGLNLDKNSFETGNKLIDGMAAGFSKMIGTARNAAVVLTSTAVAAGAVSSAELKVAASMGVATEALDTWKAAASIAGVNSNGLVSSMGRLADVMNHMTIDGSGLEAYSEKLAMLKMDWLELEKMSPDQAYAAIIRTAQAQVAAGEDEQRIRTIIRDILGTEGQGLFIELQRKGMGVDDFLAGAAATQFMTNQDHEGAANFISEVKTLTAEFKSASQLLGSAVGAELEPYVKEIADWVKDNKDDIANGIRTTAEVVGKILEKIEPLAKATGSDVGNLIKVIGKLVGGDKEGAGKLFDEKFIKPGQSHQEIQNEIDAWRNAHGYKLLQLANRADLPIDLQAKIAEEKKQHPNWGFSGIKDGIIRPDGRVTQVAPDDWVFAARNLGDLARAFVPQNLEAGPAVSNYSIVQNFTINGARDTAQVVRQQAYNGTRDGLMSLMSGSANRLQQMSGTR